MVGQLFYPRENPPTTRTDVHKIGLDSDYAAVNPQYERLDDGDPSDTSWDWYNTATTQYSDKEKYTIVAVRRMKVWKIYSTGRDLQDNNGKIGTGMLGTDLVMMLPIERPVLPPK